MAKGQEKLHMDDPLFKKNDSCRRACGRVDLATFPHQVLAATLTLSQPVGGGAG